MSDFTYELPSEEAFFKTLKEYISHKNHKQVVELLNQCSMYFAKTSTFTEVIWNTYWCSIVFSIPISELAKINQPTLALLKKCCEELLPPNCGFLIKEVNFVPQISHTPIEEAELEVVFEQQKKKLVHEISQAKFMIWAAVAWFTLDDVYELLLQKSKEGLDVRIIVSKDEINKAMYEKYKDKLNIVGYPKFGAYNDNFMHNKFCIIDLRKVIHGSYNWSKKAEYNKETVEVVDDRKTAENFADEFKKLYTDIKQ